MSRNLSNTISADVNSVLEKIKKEPLYFDGSETCRGETTRELLYFNQETKQEQVVNSEESTSVRVLPQHEVKVELELDPELYELAPTPSDHNIKAELDINSVQCQSVSMLSNYKIKNEPLINTENQTDSVVSNQEIKIIKPEKCLPDYGKANLVKDEKPMVLFELFEDGGTTVQSCPAAETVSVYTRTKQQLAMTCVVRLERLRQSQCQPCYVTATEASLTTHMKDIHHQSLGVRAGVKKGAARPTYFCDVCAKGFKVKSVLARHIGIHSGLKPYECNICKNRFTVKRSLIKHVKLHTGQKPFTCDICNKRFTERGTLTKHIRIHTGQRPYGCEICNKRFNESSKLSRHNRIHTGQKPYNCDVCNEKFSRKDYVTRLMKLHSVDTNTEPD